MKIFNPKYLLHSSRGICPICSRNTLFMQTDKPELIRNHSVCIFCRSISRHRAIALCIMKEFASLGIQRLSDFSRHPEIKVFNTSSNSPIAKALGSTPSIYNTEFFDNYQSGEYVNGVMCQDLEKLSFENDSIDLVITEDVFEHVKDIRAGFSEILRVLKSDGLHIFSIPFYFHKKTEHLFEKRGTEYVPIVLPVEYHGDGIREQIPVYHRLGYDLFDLLKEIGFKTMIHISEFHEYQKHATFNCYTFISRKI